MTGSRPGTSTLRRSGVQFAELLKVQGKLALREPYAALAGIGLPAVLLFVFGFIGQVNPGNVGDSGQTIIDLLVEGATQLDPVSPASERLCGLLRRLGELRGLDSTGIVFDSLDDYLIRAGATMVTRQTAALPVGEWGGRIGSLMASDFRALFTSLGPGFNAALGVPAAETEDLVRDAQEEWEKYHTTYSFAVAYGQKPR